MSKKIKPQWQKLINDEQVKPYFVELNQKLSKQRANGDVIFPVQV